MASAYFSGGNDSQRPTYSTPSIPRFPSVRSTLYPRPEASSLSFNCSWRTTFTPFLSVSPAALAQLCDLGIAYAEGRLSAGEASVPLYGEFSFVSELDPWALTLAPPSRTARPALALHALPAGGWRSGGGSGPPAPPTPAPRADASQPLCAALSYSLVHSASDLRAGAGLVTLTVQADMLLPMASLRCRVCGPRATPALAATPIATALLTTRMALHTAPMAAKLVSLDASRVE